MFYLCFVELFTCYFCTSPYLPSAMRLLFLHLIFCFPLILFQNVYLLTSLAYISSLCLPVCWSVVSTILVGRFSHQINQLEQGTGPSAVLISQTDEKTESSPPALIRSNITVTRGSKYLYAGPPWKWPHTVSNAMTVPKVFSGCC